MDNRYYFSTENFDGQKVVLDGQEFVHLAKVRRVKINDDFMAFCLDGMDYRFKVTKINKNNLEGELLDVKSNQAQVHPNISVFLASIKNDALYQALDNLTQLNINNIYVFESEYTNAKYKESKTEKIFNHLIQSAKQCERADIPKVQFISFDEMLTEIQKNDITICAYENANTNINEIEFEKLKDKSVGLVIGGEGGFSPKEIELLSSYVKIVSLGKTILRAPVATTALCSAVLANLGFFAR